MPRSPRLIIADGTYHVIARGNNSENIFRDDFDRFVYLELLGKAAAATAVRVLAYALMSNHVHLLLQTAAPNIDDAIRRIHGRYAVLFNQRHGRSGHLFGRRYLGILVLEDAYLLQVTRYIHLNPVRAGLVRNPEDYLWSSYREYVNPDTSPCLADPRPVLGLLGANMHKTRAAYAEFVLEEPDRPAV